MSRGIAVIGLGKLGSCLAAALASSGDRDVMGYDINEGVVRDVLRGQAPVDEPGLQDLMERVNGRNLFATGDMSDVAGTTNIAFVIVPTPSDDTGWFDNRFVVDAVTELGKQLAGDDRHYTVVIVSTVMPGSCNGPIRAALEEASGRRVGDSLSLVYSPEFIALGTVLHDMRVPDIILIGCDDPTGAAEVAPLLGGMVDFDTADPHVHVMPVLDAELAKLSLNVALSVKIAYANEVALIAERIGADGVRVLNAVGDDSRIGRKYLQPGGPAAGPCLPRDLVAFDQLAATVNRPALVAKAAGLVHTRLGRVLLGQLLDRATKDSPVIGIIGAAYKAGTAVTDESIGVRLAEGARAARCPVVMFDPKADLANLDVRVAPSAQQVADEADVVLVATALPGLTVDYHGKPVLDLWGAVPAQPGVQRFGRGED